MNNLDAFDRAVRLRDSNPSEAARLWRDLAERGDLDAAYNLGLLLRERVPDEAASWLTVVAKSGDDDAALSLGCLLEDMGRFEDAAGWFQQAATAEDAAVAGPAAFSLGQLLLRQGRAADAVRWWRQAAESHHSEVSPIAAFQLGVAVQDMDRTEAERWWRYAAARGHPGAAFNLVGMVDESVPEIPGWLLTATRSGDRELKFRAVHRLSRLVSVSDREACLAQLARDGTQALQAGHKGLAAELMICRGILVRDWGDSIEAESILRAAALLCAEISDIEGESKARSELLVLLARIDSSAAHRELVRITELGAEFAALREDHQMEGEFNLGLARLLDED